MSRRSFRPAAIAVAACFLLSCSHLPEERTVAVPVSASEVAPFDRSFGRQVTGAFLVESIIYRPTELPLSVFFARLARGDLNGALHRMRLKYVSTNVDNEALKIMIAHGIVPAVVRVRNIGSTAVDARRLRLQLKGMKAPIDAIDPSDLPSKFRGINWPGIGANAFNITMVVVASAVAIAALYEIDEYHKRSKDPGSADEGKVILMLLFTPPALVAYAVAEWNSSKSYTNIDYHDLLLAPGSIAPGQGVTGLVFFNAGKGVDWSSLRLSASMVDRSQTIDKLNQ